MTYSPGVWIDDLGNVIGGLAGLLICLVILYAAYFALRGQR